MVKNEITRIAAELELDGYCKTSFELLGLSLDAELTKEIGDLAALGAFNKDAAKLTEHVTKNDMAMIRDKPLRELGRRLIAPVVNTLYSIQPPAWELYTVNRYDTVGATLGSHQDHIGTTVLIATVCGSRQLDIYHSDGEPDVFNSVERSFQLEPGSIMIMDPETDPGHAITCIDAPSISVVAGVSELIRNQGNS